jgi:thioesterase domain-containing protein/NAD(P)-dependent dehydrogenase (short-subunit alcohol dehydrogenase family)/acyl carrier protein
VVSGPVGPLVQFAETLAERDIDARRIPISIAAHSSLLDEILGEFEAQVRTIDLKKPTIPFLSNLTGTWITDDEATSAKYWVGHLRGTVQYSRCAETLLASSAATFLEVGPGRTLSSLMKQQAGFKGSAVAISSVRHPDESANDGLFFMAALGQLWAAGQPLNDEVLWPGETRHRVSMPTYPFQRQRYWIEPGAGSSAAGDDEGPSIPERSDDIGAWGFTPKWTPSTLPSGQFEERSVWLIFVDGTDIGVTIAAHLKALGHVVIEVRESDAYYQASDTRFSLSPEHGRDGYDALVKDLIATGNVPSRVLHLWQLTADESFRPGSSFFHRNLERGFYSLFFLAQALGQEGVKTPMHWTIASNGMHSVLGETLRYPEKAMALGPCRVVPREFTNITCASVDVDLPDLSAKRFGSKRILNESTARIAQQLQGEIAQPGANATVAYRDGKRYSESMVPQELLTASAPEHGGTFLITGGLGGIGGRIARHLAETQKASLVLVGRSTLPPREEWDRHLRSHGLAEARSRSITLIRSLEESGSRVLATDGDVADLERMEEIVTRATADFGPIDCVIHTAGVLRDDLILSKSYSSVEEVFAPKVHGTQVLGEVFRDRDLPLMVLFSSTSTVTAPAGQVDYVAANAFLNAFASAQNGKLARRVIALNWGIWADVGMAAKLGRKMSLGEAPQERSEPRPAEHPLLDVRIDDEHGTTFESVFSPDTHWVFDEHRTADGQALLPGTAFVEMIRASAAELGGESPFEIRDLFFFRPLAIADGVKRRVRCTLRTSDEGYDFEAQSWCETPDGTTGWERHVQARIVLRPVPRAGALDIPAIAQRCEFDSHQDDPSGIVTGQERFLKFGPRWRVLRAQAYGDGEALGRLRLDDTFASDHDSYWLPPGLLDIATGFAMPLLKGYGASEDLWVPVNYRQIAVHSPLPKDVYSWVRLTANDTESDIATFDILLTDNGGKVALEVSGFTIKRLAKNQVFAAARPPLPSELVPVDSPSAVTRNLSDAELGFQQQLEHGIRGDEGMEALDRVLREDASSVRYVSSMNLNELIQHVDHSARRTSASDTAKFSRPELDSEFIEPENEIERTLVGFWEELLGVDRVGALDSFFDLGGHSLIAVRLFAKVKKAYHVDLPISVLFEAPNVRSCARLIHDQIGTDEERQSRSESKQTRFDHLVPMHPSNPGDGTPFFLVAGMFGNVLNLRHLAHLVGTSRPFYGLQARGLYGGHKPHESFEEMATDYLAEIRAVQPHGPYLLGGFSGGGITAFEIAQQLRSSGEEVALLAFLDTPLAHAEPLSSVDKATIHLQRLTRHGPAYAVNWMKNRVKWEVGRFRERFEGEASQDDGAQEESNFHSEEIEAAFRRSLERYEPKHYPGAVHLFRPRLDEAHRLGSNRVANSERQIVWADNGWTPLVDALHVSEVPGDHDSMVLEPNVRVLASRIRRCIEQVSANGAENRMEASAPVEAHA